MTLHRLFFSAFIATCSVVSPASAQNNFGGQPQAGYPPQTSPGGYQQQQQMPQSGYQPPQQMPQGGYLQQPPGGLPPQNPPMGQQLPGYGAGGYANQPQSRPDFSRVAVMEAQDFGVAPTPNLHSGPMHGPTPSTIPGGLVITTEALFTAIQQNPRGIAIFDVLGGPEVLVGAQAAVPAGSPGSFNDQAQGDFGRYLQQVTGGNKQMPLAFYCQGVQCWMSYNAALRAINMGFKQVLWYRGGLEAWKMAGLPTQSVNPPPMRQ